MSKETISATSAADVLAYVPHALGFTPRGSFVFLTMTGKRLGATLRIDAPQHGDPAEFALMVLGYLKQTSPCSSDSRCSSSGCSRWGGRKRLWATSSS